MAKPEKIREVRLINTGTTFNTGFVAANNAAWNTTNTYMTRVQTWDASGLVYESQPDGTLQTRLHGAPYNVPTLRKGAVKFKTYMPSANSGTTIDAVANVLGAVFGGTVAAPSGRTILCAGGSNTTHINFQTSVATANGGGLLCGVRGDGRGNGEVRSQLSMHNSNTVILNMALQAAPSSGDVFVCAHTVFLDEDQGQTYVDGMAVGQESSDVVQWIGSMGTVKFSGTNPGELPSCEFEFLVADWREQQGVSLSTTTSPQGNRPPVERGLGGFFINAACASQTNWAPRATMQVGGLEVDPGVTYEMLPDPNGVNGIGGWVRMPSSPKIKFTAVHSNAMPGGYTDWNTPNAKQTILQFGHQQGGCCAVELPYWWLDGAPVRKPIQNLAGVEVSGHGDESPVTQSDMTRSSIRVHVF